MPAPSDIECRQARPGTWICRSGMAAFALALAAAMPWSVAQPLPNADDMARALQKRPMPTPERLANEPKRAVPQIGADPTAPGSTGALDIAAMARQGATLTAPARSSGGASDLRIFITLDMPRASLKRLVDQAHRAGATLVLRGLKAQSMRQTAAAAADLIENRTVSWVIDPDAFTRYRVSAAPTFVLSLTDTVAPANTGLPQSGDLPRCGGAGCTSPAADDSYLTIAGDVSLDYALNAMLRHSPEAAPRASAFLKKLRQP